MEQCSLFRTGIKSRKRIDVFQIKEVFTTIIILHNFMPYGVCCDRILINNFVSLFTSLLKHGHILNCCCKFKKMQVCHNLQFFWQNTARLNSLLCDIVLWWHCTRNFWNGWTKQKLMNKVTCKQNQIRKGGTDFKWMFSLFKWLFSWIKQVQQSRLSRSSWGHTAALHMGWSFLSQPDRQSWSKMNFYNTNGWWLYCPCDT